MASTVPTLQEILYRLSALATNASLAGPKSEKPGRFNVVVRPETRAFLEAQAEYLSGSIAGVAGSILDGVAMATQGRDGPVSSLRGIADRFSILLKEHGLSTPASVEALQDLGFSLADFASDDALLMKLSSPTLRAVAERFHVEYEWLVGKDHEVISTGINWYKQVPQAADTLLAAKESAHTFELCLCIHDQTDLANTNDNGSNEKLPHFIPVLIRSNPLLGDEMLQTYEVWEEGRWSYSLSREHIKLVLYFANCIGIHVTGRTLPRNQYGLLKNGLVLPASVLRHNTRISWHPTDYVQPSSPVGLDKQEWARIESSSENHDLFRHFGELLILLDRK